MKTLLVILGVIVLLILVPVFSYITAYNFGNRSEQAVQAAWDNNENILAQYGQKVQEAAQITALQRDDLREVFTGAIEARYGGEGSQATFQWIQEQNPNLDSSVYIKVQQIVEAGRNEFRVAQTRLVDMKRTYRTGLGSFWRGFWLGIAGYPKVKIGYPIGSEDGYPVISTTRAKGVFESGQEKGPIKLR